MVTTIKVYPKTKSALDTFKQKNESYDHAIRRLVLLASNKHLKQKLKEAYQQKSKEDLAILEEWEIASKEVL